MLTTWFLSHFLLLLGFLLAIVVTVQMIRQRRSPAGSLAWLLAMVLVPYLGIPLYLMLGGRKVRRLAESKAELQFPEQCSHPSDDNFEIDHLMRSFGLPAACPGHQIKLLGSGEQGYAALVAMIEQARTSLWVSTFILHPDGVGQDIIERLSRQASAGVEVRVLLDGVGSLHTGKQALAPLIEAGGEVAFFMPVLHRPFRGRSNLRNHRKAVIADGQCVWAGGTNIANEYIGPNPDDHRWRDLSFVLEGPAVQQYRSIFCSDWQFTTGRKLSCPQLDPSDNNDITVGKGVVQVVPSGPDVSGDFLYSALISAVFQAKKQIWIVTPYFIPDETLVQALSLAAHRGVDVRVLVPEVSNHWLADMARGPYLRDLQQAGGQIHLYQGGMVHGKAFLADNTLAVIGSANFDMRSLFLNYETGLLVYSEVEIQEIREWIENLASNCRCGVPEVGVLRDLGEGVSCLLAPIL